MKSASGHSSWTTVEPLYRLKADMFKGVAHPVRVRILELLVGEAEVPVSKLMAATGLEASHLSQHLAVLRRHRLVIADRRASHVYYRLAFPEVAELLHSARRLLAQALESSHGQLSASQSLPMIRGEEPATELDRDQDFDPEPEPESEPTP